jgi:putative acetyltransferase
MKKPAHPDEVVLREYQPADAPALVEVYRDAIRTMGATAYSPAQVQAWARWPGDSREFEERLQAGLAVVAVREQEIVAFGTLNPVDHIDLLFCKGSHGRRGITTRIYEQLEEHARAAGVEILSTEASRIARPFFEKQGFHVVEREVVERHGVHLDRFRMEKRLT